MIVSTVMPAEDFSHFCSVTGKGTLFCQKTQLGSGSHLGTTLHCRHCLYTLTPLELNKHDSSQLAAQGLTDRDRGEGISSQLLETRKKDGRNLVLHQTVMESGIAGRQERWTADRDHTLLSPLNRQCYRALAKCYLGAFGVREGTREAQ